MLWLHSVFSAAPSQILHSAPLSCLCVIHELLRAHTHKRIRSKIRSEGTTRHETRPRCCEVDTTTATVVARREARQSADSTRAATRQSRHAVSQLSTPLHRTLQHMCHARDSCAKLQYLICTFKKTATAARPTACFTNKRRLKIDTSRTTVQWYSSPRW